MAPTPQASALFSSSDVPLTIQNALPIWAGGTGGGLTPEQQQQLLDQGKAAQIRASGGNLALALTAQAQLQTDLSSLWLKQNADALVASRDTFKWVFLAILAAAAGYAAVS